MSASLFDLVGAAVFFGAACFSFVVIARMVRGYWPLIVAALNDQPLPRTSAMRMDYRRRVAPAASSFTPRRFATQPRPAAARAAA